MNETYRRRNTKIFWESLIVLLAILMRVVPVYAGVSDYLNATIKISICGNGTVEGGEDCEGEDLNGEDCEEIGYGPGDLSCDIACSFDVYGCSPLPTPTATPTPTTTSSSSNSSTSSNTSSLVSSSSDGSSSNSVVATVLKSLNLSRSLPTVISAFDVDKDDRITVNEVYVVAKTWVDDWKQALIEDSTQGRLASDGKERRCDLNGDRQCGLEDFSILMSYVGK